MKNVFKLFAIALVVVIVFSFTSCDNGNKPEPNQTPVASDYTIGNLNQTAGSVTAVTITAKNGKSTGTVLNVKYNGNTTIPQTAGTYAVTFDVATATGWNEAVGLYAGNLVVTDSGSTGGNGDGDGSNGSDNLGGGGSESNGGGDNNGTNPDIVGVTGVFVAGYVNYVYPPDTTINTRATLWKDGVSETLSNQYSLANSVYVSGSDVYVAGYVGSNSDMRATIWKNSIAQTLSDQYSNALSVYVSGSDVYVTGYVGSSPDNRATLWKNGIAQTLSDQSSYSYSVYVSGSDVYVAGLTSSGLDNRATLWKNGIAQTLSDQYSSARSVFVSGADVYVAGYSGASSNIRATLWKNGSAQTMRQHSMAFSVYVSGANVYMAGDVGTDIKITDGGYQTSNPKAMLWKNGIEQNLNNQFGGSDSVYVSGSDVYVAGRDAAGMVTARLATLWKNNSAQTLINENSVARSVFVVPDNGGTPGGGAIPGTPTGLSAKGSSSSTIDLNWNTVSGATGYNIYRSTSATGSYVKTGSVQSPPVYNYNLPASTTYYYKISAYNSYGESSQSSYVSATTLATSSSGGGGGGGSATAGTLTISGCPYTTSNANANVHAVIGSVTGVSSYLSTQAGSAAGSGIIASSNTVTWTGTKVPNGSFTIVVDILQGGSLKYYKASGVSLNNGSGTVSWGSFSQFN